MKKAIYSSGKRLLSLLLVAVMLLSVLPLGALAADEGLSFAVTCNGAGVSRIKVSYAVVVTPVDETAQQPNPSGFSSTAETDETGVAAIDLGADAQYLSDDTKAVTLFWKVSGAKDYEAASGSLVLTEETATVPVVLTAVAPQPEMAKVTYEAPENGTLTVTDGATTIESGSEIEVETVVTITATANDHYHIVSVTANGAPLTPETDGSYSARIDKDTVIAATIEIDKVNVSVATADRHGTVSFESNRVDTTARNIDYGSTVTIYAKPNNKFYFNEAKFSPETAAADVVVEEDPNGSNGVIITFTVTDNVSVVVSFTDLPSATVGAKGDIKVYIPEGIRGVEKEENKLFVIYPEVPGKEATETEPEVPGLDRGYVRIQPADDNNMISLSGNRNDRQEYRDFNNSTLIETLFLYDRQKKAMRAVSDQYLPIYVVLDETAPTVTITGSYFKGTGSIAWSTTDPAAVIEEQEIEGGFSGLAEVTYAITQLEVIPPNEEAGETEPTTNVNNIAGGVLYSCEDALEAPGELLEQSIALNNLKDGVYTLTLTATDFAGNTGTFSKEITIDNVGPVISYMGEDNPADGDYDNVPRQIELFVADTNLNAKTLVDEIEKCITATPVPGNEAGKNAESFTVLEPVRSNDPAGYTVVITFQPGYEYEATFSCTDKAKNPSQILETRVFTLETDAPVGKITFNGDSIGEAIISALSFGLIYTEQSVDVALEYSDAVALKSAKYITLSEKTAKDLMNNAGEDIITDIETNAGAWISLAADKTEATVSVAADSAIVVLLLLEDMAGNRALIGSNGLIVSDNSKPVMNLTTDITVDGSCKQTNGFYTDDVLLHITLNDANLTTNAYSGIAKVGYRIVSTGIDGKTVLCTGESSAELAVIKENRIEINKTATAGAMSSIVTLPDPDHNRIKTVKADLTVKKDDFNSNDVKVYIWAEDLAGNTYESPAKELAIDVTKPTITVTPSSVADYVNVPQVFTVTVTERNFDEDAFVAAITAKEGIAPKLVGWNHSIGDGNGDSSTHTATYTFSTDGVYSFTLNCMDKAGWAADAVSVKQFTVDRTAPKITVSYDNNDVANGKYFKAYRTATVTIVEHNFDPGRVIFTPAHNVAWSNSGDTHTATIAYNEDGNYTLAVSAHDKADNASEPTNYTGAAPQDFVIDTTFEDMIGVEGVEDKTAYGYTDTVIPEINISDTNLDGYEITLTGEQRGESIDLSEQVAELVEEKGNVVSAVLDLFAKQRDLDGIYTLTVNSTDLAGNADEQVVTFTVNRYGSVYSYDDYVKELIRDGGAFVQSVDDNLTFTIYNASPIDENNISVVITRDGRPIEAAYTVEKVSDGNGWYSYLVTIDKSCVADDGIYAISVTSTDDAANTVENTDENSDGDIKFYVDSTAPQLSSVIGLEERIVNAAELEVSYTVYDTIGLASVEVTVDGEVVDSATEFEDASNYAGSFVISEKSNAQHVRFVLTDKAGNVTDSDANNFEVPYVLEKDVTVSTNLFVRWYANPGLFWGPIGGVGALAVGFGVVAAAKRKKKEEVEV